MYKRQVMDHDFPAGGAGGGDKPLHLQAGDHVGIIRVAVFRFFSRIKNIESCRHQDGADLERNNFVFLFEIYSPGPAGIDTFRALAALAPGQIETLLRVDGIPCLLYTSRCV